MLNIVTQNNGLQIIKASNGLNKVVAPSQSLQLFRNNNVINFNTPQTVLQLVESQNTLNKNVVSPEVLNIVEKGEQGQSGRLLWTAYPTGKVLTANDNYTGNTNQGAAAIAPFQLPLAATAEDLYFSFLIQNSEGLQVIAAGEDVINLGGVSTNEVYGTKVGSIVDVFNINSTEWFCKYWGIWFTV